MIVDPTGSRLSLDAVEFVQVQTDRSRSFSSGRPSSRRVTRRPHDESAELSMAPKMMAIMTRTVPNISPLRIGQGSSQIQA